jgi:hypothetical protein
MAHPGDGLVQAVRCCEAQRCTDVGLPLQNSHLRRLSSYSKEMFPYQRSRPLMADTELRPMQR